LGRTRRPEPRLARDALGDQRSVERRTEIFERFTRLDSARSGGAGRAGLGLAIAHDLVVRHDGRIFVDGDGPGARFVVTLPASDRA